jgi:hypothetical protein
MEVRVDAAAAEFARSRGGSIYIWVSESGLLRVKTSAPHDEDWAGVVTEGGVEVFVAPSAADVESWHIALVRFPWKRLAATSNMTGGLGQDPSGGIGSGVW